MSRTFLNFSETVFQITKRFCLYTVYIGNIIREKYSNVGFVCVGDGPQYNHIRQTYENNQNSNGLYYLGKQVDVESIISIFDIGVLTTYTEGISNSIMEYMALGKPVIATDGGGTKELLNNKISGYLISVGDKKDLVDKLIFLINHPSISKEMGRNGRKIIKAKFNIDLMIDKYKKLYNYV